MPIDKLMSMYGYSDNTVPKTSIKKKKKKKGPTKKCKDKKRKVIISFIT